MLRISLLAWFFSSLLFSIIISGCTAPQQMRPVGKGNVNGQITGTAYMAGFDQERPSILPNILAGVTMGVDDNTDVIANCHVWQTLAGAPTLDLGVRYFPSFLDTNSVRILLQPGFFMGRLHANFLFDSNSDVDSFSEEVKKWVAFPTMNIGVASNTSKSYSLFGGVEFMMSPIGDGIGSWIAEETYTSPYMGMSFYFGRRSSLTMAVKSNHLSGELYDMHTIRPTFGFGWGFNL